MRRATCGWAWGLLFWSGATSAWAQPHGETAPTRGPVAIQLLLQPGAIESENEVRATGTPGHGQFLAGVVLTIAGGGAILAAPVALLAGFGACFDLGGGWEEDDGYDDGGYGSDYDSGCDTAYNVAGAILFFAGSIAHTAGVWLWVVGARHMADAGRKPRVTVAPFFVPSAGGGLAGVQLRL